MLIKKLKSEVYFGNPTHKVDEDNIIIYVPAVNYYGVNGSLGKFQYSLNLGAIYNDCTLAESQLEADLDDIPIEQVCNDKRLVPIVWAAAQDISAIEKFTNVKIKITFYDEANQAGTESEELVYTINEIDMRPTETITLIKPYVADNVMNILFKSLTCVYDIRTHFRVQVAVENDTAFANPILDFMSEVDQTGWTVNSLVFPAAGVPTEKSIADVSDISFTHADLDNLPNGVYNIRVLRSLHDSPLMPTYPEEW